MCVVLAKGVEVLVKAGIGPEEDELLYAMGTPGRQTSTGVESAGIELQAARTVTPTDAAVFVEVPDALRVQTRLSEALPDVADDRARAPARDIYRLATVLGVQ